LIGRKAGLVTGSVISGTFSLFYTESWCFQYVVISSFSSFDNRFLLALETP